MASGYSRGIGSLDEKCITLELFGQAYRLRCDDPDVDIRAMVEYVRAKVAEQEGVHYNLPTHKQIVLTILNVARDYIVARDRLRSLEEALANRARHLAAKIDAAVEIGLEHRGDESEEGKG